MIKKIAAFLCEEKIFKEYNSSHYSFLLWLTDQQFQYDLFVINSISFN